MPPETEPAQAPRGDGTAAVQEARARYLAGDPLPLDRRLELLEPVVRQGELADPRDQAWARLLLADAYEEQGRRAEGLELVALARRGLEACGDREGLLRCAMVEAELHLVRDDADLARAVLGEALEGAAEASPRTQVGLWNLSARLASLAEDYLGALTAYERGLALCEAHGLAGNRVRLLTNVAALHLSTGMIGPAVEAATHARDLMDGLGDELDALTRAAVLRNLAFLLLRDEQPARALEVADACLAAYRAAGLPDGMAAARNARLQALQRLGRLDEAREVARAAVADLDGWCKSDRAPEALSSLARSLRELGDAAGLRRILCCFAWHVNAEDEAEADELLFWRLVTELAEDHGPLDLVALDGLVERAGQRDDLELQLETLELRVEACERAGDLAGALADQRRLTRLQAERLHARMGRQLDRASDRERMSVGLGDLEQRVHDRMGELDAAYRRLEVEERARREAKEREDDLHRDLQRALRLESLGRLAGGVAHDFNNLLTVIQGCAEQLGDQGQPVDEILKASGRGQRLVAQLLAFGRRQDLHLEQLEADEVVAATAPLLARLLGEDLELVREPGAPGTLVRIDRAKFESVLMNLVLNARDAMPAGGRIEVRSRREGGTWVLAVHDQGPGILPEHQDVIFDPFFTTRDEGEGGGMGLASALGIAKRLGGDLVLAESSRFGSVFELHLPLAKGQEPAPTPAPPFEARPPEPGAEARLDGARILVVEDDEAIRRLVQGALGRHGAEVETAPDGRAGLERLTRLPTVDLVLCDVIMPGMGGPELFRHLVERDLAVPFLFTSGYPDRWNLEEFEGLGRIGFLPKPFDLATLARRVGELLL